MNKIEEEIFKAAECMEGWTLCPYTEELNYKPAKIRLVKCLSDLEILIKSEITGYSLKSTNRGLLERVDSLRDILAIEREKELERLTLETFNKDNKTESWWSRIFR